METDLVYHKGFLPVVQQRGSGILRTLLKFAVGRETWLAYVAALFAAVFVLVGCHVGSVCVH